MKYVLLLACLYLSSCGNVYYIVRHGEKAVPTASMGSDVELSAEGKQRAQALKERLKGENISFVYSTNTIRTRSTGQPTADNFNLNITPYGPRPDSAFIALLKTLNRNTLVVGHSNTIDDVVNMLCGEKKIPGDLPETEYDNLFIVKRKGKKFVFEAQKY